MRLLRPRAAYLGACGVIQSRSFTPPNEELECVLNIPVKTCVEYQRGPVMRQHITHAQLDCSHSWHHKSTYKTLYEFILFKKKLHFFIEQELSFVKSYF